MFNNNHEFNEEELDSENFIPDENNNEETLPEENDEDTIDIHDLLFIELTELLNNQNNKKSPAITSWLIGERLRRTLSIITDEEKAKLAFEALQKQIAARFGHEFTLEKLYSCVKLADDFPDLTIFEEYAKQISLEHLLQIIKIESDMARTFYCEMTKLQNWSAQELQKHITAKLFEKEFGE